MSISAYRCRKRVIGLCLVLLGALAVAGCTGSGSAESGTTAAVTTPSPRAAATTPSRTASPQSCGDGATPVWISGPHGIRLAANHLGSGTRAVVFMHEIGAAGMCGFYAYASWLTQHRRVQAILVNRCNYGSTVCPTPITGDAAIKAETEPAVTWARAHGAKQVALVGASGGGGDAVQAAGLIDGVSSVVDISGEVTDTASGGLSPVTAAAARRVHVPALFAVAPDDPDCSVSGLRKIYRLAPAESKSLLVVSSMPGVHGWDLLSDPYGKPYPLALQVAAWVTGH